MTRPLPYLHTLLAAVVFLAALGGMAQQEVTVHGRVNAQGHQGGYYDLMVVNKRTRSGAFGNADGTFTVRMLPTDTVLVGLGGYVTKPFSLRDSVPRPEYRVLIVLSPWTIVLPEASVLSERTLRQIQQDIAKLGYKESDYRVSTVDALQSPITFLYQEFSRRERSRREVARLQNEDRKRALLKELLHKYAEYDIINLGDESFDDFIDFCAVPDAVMQGLSQYEFLLYVKKKYELYTSLGPTRRY
ncbi:MAG: hypothetical protein IT228_03520 [Flavobacteriales bacterium]|nr:hypothetical protein [Flavobacteriales bacterium]MCC6576390.1 hypothetical protein [Flavobacteriales bacterium]NUQ14949.1 hypothetical protein [Flavobacteriales bacterium]